MKILLISNLFPSNKSPSFGTFVKTNFEQLKSMAFDVDLCVIDEKSNNFFEKAYNYLLFFFLQFKQFLIYPKKYDIYYIHYLTISTLPLYISMKIFRVRVRYFINVHGDDLVGSSLKHRILSIPSKYILAHAEGVVVPSEFFKKILLEKFGNVIEVEKLCVNNSGGVDTNRFKRKEFDSERLYLESKPKVFGYVGRIEEGKGWDDFLDAILKIEKSIEAQFHIYGGGQQVSQLIERIGGMDDKLHVKYFGEACYSEIPQIMASFDYLVFPTHRESLGLVGLEAASVGIPVIRTRIAVLDSIFWPFEFLSFCHGDIDALADLISYTSTIGYQNYLKLSESHSELASQYSYDRSCQILFNFINGHCNERMH
ncbi:TPA: glycosyltransferase [Vibrio vulnificus]|nr:glycosyltransferase [Vibrio vulnificus]HDY7583829.1 glycosyltransferase family 4 protein [Vibrio vulnificus]